MNPSDLKSSYYIIEPRAKRLKSAITEQLDHLISQSGATLGVPIEARVKDWSSIEEKVMRKSLNLLKIEDLDDLVGVRLILLFRKDLTAVDKLLHTSLNIKSSEDTSLRLADTQFGYQSQHYIVEVPIDWLNIPTWADLGGIRIEIQVRTLAQHIWAAASHKLQYKHEASVPLPLRRSINRASALLETVDIEFDRLLEDRSTYLNTQMNKETPDTPLNVEIIDAVLSKIFPPQNRRDDEPYDDLMIDLKHFGIKTAKQLENLMTKHLTEIMKKDAELAKTEFPKRDFYFQHIGLAREGLRREFGEDVVSRFLVSKK